MKKYIFNILFSVILFGIFLYRIIDGVINYRYIVEFYKSGGVFVIWFMCILPYILIIMGTVAVFINKVAAIIIATLTFIIGGVYFFVEGFWWIATGLSGSNIGFHPMLTVLLCGTMLGVIIFKAVHKEQSMRRV